MPSELQHSLSAGDPSWLFNSHAYTNKHLHPLAYRYTKPHAPTLLGSLLRPHVTYQWERRRIELFFPTRIAIAPCSSLRDRMVVFCSFVTLSMRRSCVLVCVYVCVRGKTLGEGGNRAERVVGVILCNMEIISFYQRAFEKLRFLRRSSKLLGLSDVSLTFLIAHY